MNPLRTRLLGLGGVLAIATFVVGVPALLVAIGATPTFSEFSWSALTARDDGTFAVSVIGLVAWVAWAMFAVSILLDVVARMRGRHVPQLPGLGLPQVAAGRLVGIAALLFVAVPTISTAAPVPYVATAAEPSVTPQPVSLTVAPVISSSSESTPPAPAHRDDTEAYTVKRGDSLWKIAKERLGDGTRYVELADLNRGILDGEPDFLLPGTVLRVPSTVAPTDDTSYVVEPGDTMSEIAEDELGDAEAYRQIFQASRTTVQPDGEQLTDPDLIRPGWHLTLPPDGQAGSEPPPKERNAEPVPKPQESAPPTARSDSEPDSPNHAPAVSTPTDDSLPAWVLPGLAGAGGVLAGSLFLVLRQQRRTQLRFRDPGHVITPPPPELLPVEKSAHASGSVAAPRVEVLDRALRQLGESMPGTRITAATVSPTHVSVTLREAAELPQPWNGRGSAWNITHGDVPSEVPAAIAPYPLLVSVGMDPDGALVLINLEELHAATIIGDPDKATALGRHIAAELVLSPWSVLAEVDTVGIGEELADIDPSRLHHHAVDDTAFLDQLAEELESEDPALEPDQFRTLIAMGDLDSTQKLAKIITGYQGRSGAAVLVIGAEDGHCDCTLSVTSTGSLNIGSFGLTLTAAGLTVDEAKACAALVDITRDIATTPVPADQSSAVADAAGALKDELTEPRPAAGPAGERSLLPEEESEYESRAATVREDVRRLAPLVPVETEQQIAETDPQLDEDVARWQASRLIAPKLTLLGPVGARTLGDSRKMAHRRPFYVELLTFLTLHPHGVTATEIAQAFGIQPERARKDVGIVRSWLGRDPSSGKPYLPNARQTHADGVQGRYGVNGVATDLDLFRRLRTRGESRGAAGIEDLTAALSLVTGEPFTDLRPAGWAWLLDGERLDHIMTCAIVDTAHIVTTHALSTGDLELARFAAETAVDSAPYDEVSQLDLIAVDEADGKDDRAAERLTGDVLNRSDDGLGPVDVPPRSAQVMQHRGWNQASQRTG